MADRDSREKETKILNLTRELDELRELFDKQKSLTTSQQRELDDLMSSKDDVGKSVRFNYFYILRFTLYIYSTQKSVIGLILW